MRSVGGGSSGRRTGPRSESDLGARTLFGALGGAVAGLFFALPALIGVVMRGDSMESRMLWQIPVALLSAGVFAGAVAGSVSGSVRGAVTKMIAGGICGVVFVLTAAVPYIGPPWNSRQDDSIAAAVGGLLLGMIMALLIKDERPN